MAREARHFVDEVVFGAHLFEQFGQPDNWKCKPDSCHSKKHVLAVALVTKLMRAPRASRADTMQLAPLQSASVL